MPRNIDLLVDNRDVFLRGFVRMRTHSVKRLREAAPRIGSRLLQELRKRQPIGKPDPLVEEGYSDREERPSVRQRLVPIEEGWLRPIVKDTRGGAEVSVWSLSAHLKYFTKMTGRRYLGTRLTRPIVARNHPFLWFWWAGEPKMVGSSRPRGFRPRTDFAKEAFDATDEFVRYETGESVRLGFVDTLRSLWTRMRR